ncbi:hypothetical protein [Mycoplasma sp. SG1]|uniref:hypothetical protein n=1 Tax=Mycoplasma sp. SG1 TaxID=2810348 RepID=UPI002024B51B|nr:hypothetical protein [Mycoplasma sp. SG1]URM52739.1 hypothetical protein JRW51_00015 [Mycoplasma sp. SG1]
MNHYKNHQKIFQQIKDYIYSSENKKVVDEFLQLFEVLYKSYDSKINENKFIVGGVVEFFCYVLFKKIGLECILAGHKKNMIDLIVNNCEMSIKTSSKSIISNFIIMNRRGDNPININWNYATIFVISGLGFGYCDPYYINKDMLVQTSSNIQIMAKNLKKLWKDKPELFIKLNIPIKFHIEQSKIASYEIGEQIIYKNTKILKEMLDNSKN